MLLFSKLSEYKISEHSITTYLKPLGDEPILETYNPECIDFSQVFYKFLLILQVAFAVLFNLLLRLSEICK